MTSPAQLKYLNAMGIPVWVSRNLIIENNHLHDVLSDQAEKVDLNTSTVKSSVNKDSQSNHSAKSILDSLELNPEKPNNNAQNTRKNTNQDNNNFVGEALDTFVNKAKINNNIEAEIQPSTSNILPKEEIVTENLLLQSSHYYVYSVGCKKPDWMIIGHSPESFNGVGQEPFAGEDGELLNNMLRAVGISKPRSDAYLVNIVDKHLSNDIDEKIESETQLKLKNDLIALIDNVKPKIILFVGQIAAQNLLDCKDPLIIMRSKVHTLNNTNIPCVVTYYPSYLLQKPIDKRKAWDDLKLAMSLLN
ncbi:MAG: uracil-DNA glycosylase family 4 [Cocleimonas sp.]|jgi:uracil-DNA glycosylase family 4